MKHLILFFFFSVSALFLHSQCPEKTWLWNRIVYLRDSSGIPPATQLAELVPYLTKMDSCPSSNDSTHVLLLQRVGWLTSLRKDYVKAIQYTRAALDMVYSHQNDPKINFSHVIKFYNNLRILYDSLGQSRLKKEAMDSCISIALRLNSGFQFAIPLINFRTIDFFEAGDYYRCIDYASLGVDLVHQTGYSLVNIYDLLSWKLNALIFLDRFQEAEKLLTQTLDECSKAKALKYLGSLYGIQARLFAEKNDFKQAIVSTHLSCEFSKKTGYKNGCAEALNNFAYTVYYRKLRQLNAALLYYRTALPYADSSTALSILDNIATLFVEKSSFDSAFHYFREAFQQLRQGMSLSGILNNPESVIKDPTAMEYIVDLVLDNADAHLKAAHMTRDPAYAQQAAALYRQADRFLEKIRLAQPEYFSRLFWRSHYRRLYENAIKACYLLDNSEAAFFFFEKSRAVLLNDQLEEQQGSREPEILQLAQLKKALLQLDDSLRNIPDTAALRLSIQNERFTASQQLDLLQQSIKSRNPLYYQSFLDTSFTTLADARARLSNDHQSLIELFTGDSADYLLLITPTTIHLSPIDKHDLDSTTTQFTSYLSDPTRSNAHFPDFTNTASHLYQLLFGTNPPPDGRIIVSEDSHWFPFEALITSMTSTGPRYFLFDHPVSYTYSFRYLSYSTINRPLSDNSALFGVAPVQYAEALHLNPLNGSEVSLHNIASAFPRSTLLLSKQATRANFLQQFFHYPIIQLYTHASDSGGARNEPVVYFADSALYLSDLIPESKPATRLIVLSACETGSGRLYQGEGVFSFNRGFAALGIPSSITNLWAVDDQSTYRLTELFYHYLAKGLPVDQALQKAKLDFIGDGTGEKSLPYYWAAPVFAGDSSFTLAHTNMPPMWFFLAVGLVIIFLIAWLILKRRYHR